jgi:uncharacterized membrane protein
MIFVYVAIFILGFTAGLRVFTPPAVVYLARGGVVGYVLALFALGEMVGDALPNTPARTIAPFFLARLISGGFVGWVVAQPYGSPMLGILIGIVGALVGTQIGLRIRTIMMKSIGAIPAALLEDFVAILLAIFAVHSYSGLVVP